ncbi:MAG TPA: transglycosylase SLT domain-containing protein [Pseudonocardiaceae bacterium]|jgi:hypothetical protein|nr:transglycosylase SLT domain-containing protein [Pseudonocardiaceae bacterium]
MSSRTKLAIGGCVAAVLLLAGIVTFVVSFSGSRQAADASQQGPLVTSHVTPPPVADTPAVTTPDTTTVTPPPTTAPTTTTAATTKRTTALYQGEDGMPAPTQHPVTGVQLPPPPHQAPVPGCTPSHSGTAASAADVKSALVTSGSTQYWSGVRNPPMEAGDTPAGSTPTPTGPPAQITLPANLMEAIGWQESGWQSNITACDGGVGAMQIMSATASWMNQRYGTQYVYQTLSGNTAIGGEYLEWLVAYFGENYFGYQYDLSNPDLLAAVIDAYNAGANNVTFANGHTVVSSYAADVEKEMTTQPWTAAS